MSRYVVDACVAVKWCIPEVASDRAVAILKRGHELLAPELILSEFGNIIWKKVSRGSLSALEGGESLDVFLGTRPVACYPVAPYTRGALTADERFANALQNTPVSGYVSLQ